MGLEYTWIRVHTEALERILFILRDVCNYILQKNKEELGFHPLPE